MTSAVMRMRNMMNAFTITFEVKLDEANKTMDACNP